jgi:hypothetical protein
MRKSRVGSPSNGEGQGDYKPFVKSGVNDGFLKPSFKPNMTKGAFNYTRPAEVEKKEDEDGGDDDFEDDFEMDTDWGGNTNFTFDLNVQGAKEKAVDLDQYEEQKSRVQAIKRVIQLETEGFELMSITPASIYQNYVSKLTNGTIRNCAEQTNEENRSVEVQTTMGEAISAGTQFPEISMNTLVDKEYSEVESGARLRRFVEKIAPTIEEMIQFSERQLPNSDKSKAALHPPTF